MVSRIPLVENGRVIGIDGQPLASAPVNAWEGFRVEVHPHMRRGEVADRSNGSPLILVRVGARGACNIVSGASKHELSLDDGQADVFAPGFQMDRGRWDCTPGEVIAIELNEPLLGKMLQHEGAPLSLQTTLAMPDQTLTRLAACMRAELDQGCPSGRLFAEGLSLAVLGALRSRYSGARCGSQRHGRLSPAQVRLVCDYVESKLGKNLGVVEMAAALKLSPYHFARLFKATMGVTPYRFVLERRLQAARQQLRDDVSLADLAYSLGFSSQSHFTSVFHRETGMTPGQARRHS